MYLKPGVAKFTTPKFVYTLSDKGKGEASHGSLQTPGRGNIKLLTAKVRG